MCVFGIFSVYCAVCKKYFCPLFNGKSNIICASLTISYIIFSLLHLVISCCKLVAIGSSRLDDELVFCCNPHVLFCVVEIKG